MKGIYFYEKNFYGFNSDFSFITELDINPLLISEKTGEGIAVDGRIKVRMNDAKKFFECNCGEGCECGEICTCNH